MIGGTYAPGADPIVLLAFASSQRSRRRSCKSTLGGRSLVPGVTDEFVDPILGGLRRGLAREYGTITVDRFGWDPVETSPAITELAAQILAMALTLGHAPDAAEVTTWIESLP